MRCRSSRSASAACDAVSAQPSRSKCGASAPPPPSANRSRSRPWRISRRTVTLPGQEDGRVIDQRAQDAEDLRAGRRARPTDRARNVLIGLIGAAIGGRQDLCAPRDLVPLDARAAREPAVAAALLHERLDVHVISVFGPRRHTKRQPLLRSNRDGPRRPCRTGAPARARTWPRRRQLREVFVQRLERVLPGRQAQQLREHAMFVGLARVAQEVDEGFDRAPAFVGRDVLPDDDVAAQSPPAQVVVFVPRDQHQPRRGRQRARPAKLAQQPLAVDQHRRGPSQHAHPGRLVRAERQRRVGRRRRCGRRDQRRPQPGEQRRQRLVLWLASVGVEVNARRAPRRHDRRDVVEVASRRLPGVVVIARQRDRRRRSPSTSTCRYVSTSPSRVGRYVPAGPSSAKITSSRRALTTCSSAQASSSAGCSGGCGTSGESERSSLSSSSDIATPR